MATTRIAAASLMVLCAAAFGQQDKPKPPDFQELLEELGNAPEPAPPTAPQPTATGGPAVMSEEARNELITRNYGETVEIYDDIIRHQLTNTQRIDQRIAKLEEMLASYRPKFEQNSAIVRGVESQLVMEANKLKADLAAGYLDKKTYEVRLKEAETRAENRMEDAREQRDFYGAEIARAQATLEQLKAEREILERNAEVQQEADIASGKVQPPQPGYLDRILARHKQLGSIGLEHFSDDQDFNRKVVLELTRTED